MRRCGELLAAALARYPQSLEEDDALLRLGSDSRGQ
jgi:hypothetical protein